MAGNIKWNNWRDRLKDASFRGVPFKVMSTSSEGGRRTVLHQYPFADEPYLEDMGKEAGTYQLQAYIVANYDNSFDHFKERDALKAALEAYGPGTLVHPFLGSKQVGLMGKYKLDESFAEGGVARFTLTFADAGRAAQPSAVLSDEGAVDEACSAADSAILVFDETLLDQVLAAAEMVNGAIAMLDAVYDSLLSIQSDVVGAISAAQTALARIRGTFVNIVQFPDQFRAAITDTLNTYDDLGLSVKTGDKSVVNAALSTSTTFAGVTDAFPVTTPQREAQQEARYWATEAGMAGALSQAVRLAVRVQYTSYDEVKAMLDALIAAIDTVLAYIGSHSKNDDLTSAVAALKPLVTNNLIAKGANLPAMRTEELPGDVQPALVLAQRMYGDIDRDQEIVDMNPIALRHPGFPEAGATIIVLSE